MRGKNRIVVDYGDYEGLVLLGTFDASGKEYDIEIWREYGFDVVKKYDGIKDFKELKSMVKDNQEGFVVKFTNGDRMKIKSEEYIRLHRILTNVSNRDIWEYLKDGKPLDEIIEKVPDEFYDWVKQTKESFITQYETLESEYKWIFKVMNRVPNINNRAVFANYAKMYKHPSILFNMLDGKNYSEIIWGLLYPSYSKPFKKENKNEI
jgi:RNA ligase